MTWIEIVDTAIKIGLGATIGGFFSLRSLINSHNHEFRKELFQRRLIILQDVELDVSNYFNKLTEFSNRAATILEIYKENKNILDSTWVDFRKLGSNLFDLFHDLGISAGKISLLGEKDVSEALGSFSEESIKLYHLCKSVPDVNQSDIDKSFLNLGTLKKSFDEKTSFAFTKIPIYRDK